MTTNRCASDGEQTADPSPTAHLLDELRLYGHRPFENEPDPRPLPDPRQLQGALADLFDALVATLSDTRLEPDLSDLLWSVVNLFHRRIDRVERHSTPTSAISVVASANRTAPKSAQWSLSASSPKAGP
jgi:hypothetical protein